MRKSFWAFAVLTLHLCACAQTSKKIYATGEVDISTLRASLKIPIRIEKETIIFDTRSNFDFALSHLPQAVNLQWSEFADLKGAYPSHVKKNLDAEVRRLALLGITPNTPIVVVGRGLEGGGEEGRLAWTLLYLGFKDVQTAHMDRLGLHYSNVEVTARKNAPSWAPVLRPSLVASREEVIRVATGKFDEHIHIIDVRSRDEYFSKNEYLQYAVPDLRAIHIEWKNFFNEQGRPNLEILDQLKSVNIQPEDRILVISNNGVRSAAVTYALLSLGYEKAANVAGGYRELTSYNRRR